MKIRTIRRCCAEISKKDPDTAVNESAVRKAIEDGTLPFGKVGNRIFVSVEEVEKRFCGVNDEKG